jgi:hypothetical protein
VYGRKKVKCAGNGEKNACVGKKEIEESNAYLDGGIV